MTRFNNFSISLFYLAYSVLTSLGDHCAIRRLVNLINDIAERDQTEQCTVQYSYINSNILRQCRMSNAEL